MYEGKLAVKVQPFIQSETSFISLVLAFSARQEVAVCFLK